MISHVHVDARVTAGLPFRCSPSDTGSTSCMIEQTATELSVLRGLDKGILVNVRDMDNLRHALLKEACCPRCQALLCLLFLCTLPQDAPCQADGRCSLRSHSRINTDCVTLRSQDLQHEANGLLAHLRR